MDGLFRKAKAKIEKFVDEVQKPDQPQSNHPPPHQSHSHSTGHHQPSSICEPSPLDILRYRYHHGTNLGSIYVIERWLHPSVFPDGASGSSELEAVKAWVERIGLDETKKKFEERWASAVSDDDIDWLVNEAKCTTIRLPIGYFDLPAAFLTQGTPFEPYAQVFAGAWDSIRTLISRLRARSVGVLIDLHALPGGANAQEHSGTNTGSADLWGSGHNRHLGVQCCKFIANEARSGLDITGIQIINEAEWDSPGMYEWYDECISVVSSVDPSIPVIISDGWNLGRAVDWTLGKNAAYPHHPTCPVIIDTHYYWAFSDEDKQKSPQQIIFEVPSKLSELNGKEGSVHDRGAVQVIVGEYSCVLTEDSWGKCGDESRQDLVKKFGEAQSQTWQRRAGGSFFWTWKMDWMPGGEWGFKAQSDPENRALSRPSHSLIPHHDVHGLLEKANHCREERKSAAVGQHCSYWDHTAPGTNFEHWRYENGWNVGYDDARAFFEGRGAQGVTPGNKIGNLEMWVLKRIRENGARGGFVWEFEQGLRKGVQDFQDVVGI